MYAFTLRELMLTYLDQLEARAKEVGHDLIEVGQRAGVAKTTIQRWRHGELSPREDTARLLFDEMDLIEREKSRGRAA